MLFSSWLRTLRPHWARTGRQTRPQSPRRRSPRLTVEQLEDRLVPSNFSAASVSNLIADINAANRAGGTNTITLTAPTTSPYILTAVDNTADGATGLPVIAANDNLTILGNGDTIARSTVSGTPAFRLLDVASKASLTLENLTLQGGFAFGSGSSAQGGGIYNQGTLDLNGVIVQSNIAQGQNGVQLVQPSAAAGGAIYSGGSVTLEGGTSVQNNQAVGGNGPHGLAPYGLGSQSWAAGQSAAGGGIYSSGSLTLESGTSVQNNEAVGGNGGSAGHKGGIVGGSVGGRGGNGLGGGVYVAGGTAILIDVTLSSNTARGGQGGNGFLFAVGITSNGQAASGAGGNGFGGALDVSGGTVKLTLTTPFANNAVGGLGGTGNGIAGLGEGGGLYIDPAATVSLDAFTLANILNNTASTSDPNIHGSYSLLP
jgi:hypothetical protein